MKFILYQNNSEKMRIDKALEERYSIIGVLRNESSVVNPQMEVQLTGLPNANYAYIPDFNRYYFIDNIVSVRNNLWLISMTVDVLMSFKEQIISQRAYVTRTAHYNEIDLKRVPLGDSLIPFSEQSKIYINDKAGSCNFSSISNTGVFYIITSFIGSLTLSSELGDGEINVRPSGYVSPVRGNIKVYAFVNPWDFDNVLNIIAKDTEINQYLIECGYLACKNFEEVFSSYNLYSSGTEYNIKVGNKTISVTNSYNKTYEFNFYTKITNPTTTIKIPLDFDREQIFTNLFGMNVYLPYYGLVEIDKENLVFDSVLDKWAIEFTITECLDVTTMTLAYNIINRNSKVINHSYNVKVGSPYAINYNNANEVKINHTANNIKAGFSIIGSTLTGVLGMLGSYAAGSASGIIQSGSNALQGIGVGASDYFIGEMRNIYKGGTKEFNSGGVYNSMCTDSIYYIVISYNDIRGLLINYEQLIGRTISRVDYLSKFSGYTQIGSIHLENIPTALDEELSMIEQQLKRGVIL